MDLFLWYKAWIFSFIIIITIILIWIIIIIQIIITIDVIYIEPCDTFYFIKQCFELPWRKYMGTVLLEQTQLITVAFYIWPMH